MCLWRGRAEWCKLASAHSAGRILDNAFVRFEHLLSISIYLSLLSLAGLYWYSLMLRGSGRTSFPVPDLFMSLRLWVR